MEFFYCLRQSTILLHVKHSSGMGLSLSRFLKYPKWFAHPATASSSAVVVFFVGGIGEGDCISCVVLAAEGVLVMHLGHA
jgi:hypothetical protein